MTDKRGLPGMFTFIGVVCLFTFAGCGGGDKPTKVVTPADGLPAGTPVNDSPDHLLARYEATFVAESNVQYAKLLTDDFRYHFSAAADPVLVSMYGENWRRADEEEAITHLFLGFTNSDLPPTYIPAASHIQMSLNGVQVLDDPSHVDSVAYYRRVVVGTVQMTIEVPNPGGDPILYQISDRHEFLVVRGDAAVLGPNQEARADRWYIRQWDDLSVPAPGFSKNPALDSTKGATLGMVKNSYHS